MSRTEVARQCLIIGAEFFQHLSWRNAFVVVIFQALLAGDIANRAQGGSPDFTRTFGKIVGHRKNLFRMFVEQQVIIPEMLPGHVPVEILGFQVQCKCISQQAT